MADDPNIITLANVRLSFPHLFKAHAMKDDQEPRFSASFIFDNKEHGALLDRIEAQAERIALDHFKKKIRLSGPLVRDGNERGDMDGYGDGTSFMSASRKSRPGAVDRQLNPIADEDNLIYAGCYVNATIRLWVQDSHGQKRVNAELRAVQFVKDGASFGAAPVDAEKEFEALPEDGSSSRAGRSRGSDEGEDSRNGRSSRSGGNSGRSSGRKVDLSGF